MKYEFIEIGTSDFETLCQTTTNQIGISVEPVKIYLDNLPNNPYVIKVNCAIGEFDEIGEVFMVDSEDILKYDLPIYLRGCNSIKTPHPTTKEELEKRSLSFLMKRIPCEIISWKKFIERYDIQEIGLLKIDTEGHDCKIINSILKTTPLILPNKLQFECNVLTPVSEVDDTIRQLIQIGYKIIMKNDVEIILEKI
jgi:hypothetical protein